MNSYCVFNVGERRVGIDLAYVREIVEHQHVEPTRIPLTPAFVRGLFNLRGQVLPYFDLGPFVGTQEQVGAPGREDRAVVVERGQLRFATTGRRVDTIEADPSTFTPLQNAALHPALDAEASTDYGRFHVIHLDRLEACLSQSLKLTDAPLNAPANASATEATEANPENTRAPATAAVTTVATGSNPGSAGQKPTARRRRQ